MPYPVLTRFDTIVYKDKPSEAPLQVPVIGAKIDFYRQGATASQDKTIGAGVETTLNVYDAGALKVDEEVMVGPDGAILKVKGIAENKTQLTVKNEGAVGVPVKTGDRLMPTGDRPLVHLNDPITINPEDSTSQLTTSLTGAAWCYISTARVDYVVSKLNEVDPRLYIDLEGGVRPSPSWVSVRDYPMVTACDVPSVQRAIDSLPALGGEVFLPAGIYEADSGIVIDKDNVTLRGAGPLATIIRARRNPDYPLLTINRFACRLYDLQFDGNSDQAGTSDLNSCIVMNGDSVSGNSVQSCLFENLRVCNGRFHGLLMRNVVAFLAINCEFEGNRRAGVFLQENGTTSRFLACRFRLNGTSGLGVNKCQITLIGCDFENNKQLSDLVGNAIDIVGCARGEVLGCRFLWASNLGSPHQFIRSLNGYSLLVNGCSFMGAGAGLNTRAKWGAKLFNSSWARFTNNVGIDLYGTTVAAGGLCSGDSLSNEVVEFGNTEINSEFSESVPRMDMVGERVFSLSRGGMALPRYASQTALNNDVPTRLLRRGAMAWVEGNGGGLRVWTGGPTWLDVGLLQP